MPDGEATSDPPVLEYASPSIGRPDNETAAERALARGESIRQLGSYFHSPHAAAVFLRWAVARQFDSEALPGPCGCCSAPATSIVLIEWRFMVPMQQFVFYAGNSNARGSTTTAHALCGACEGRLLRRGRTIFWSRRILPALTALSAFAIYWVAFPGTWPRGPSTAVMLTPIACFATTLVAERCLPIVWSSRARRMLRRPPPSWLQLVRAFK